ncbi:MAG: hypothetical protein Q7L07_12865 [Pseudohongiella sp.]|nr:hypothetical protein [Pseudohongiella sp.]
MEQVSIQIPASLYCQIYVKHEEQTTNVIIETLKAYSGMSQSKTTAKSLRPGEGTITGRVWKIADQLKAENGVANRTLVVEACMAEGINMNTANTQFSNWSKENS